MKTVMKKAFNPDTGQYKQIEMPVPEVVRQEILKLEYPDDGISIKDASIILAERLQFSDKQKNARNSSNLNLFRHNVISPQFKYLLEAGKLEQPGGPRTPYFLAENSSDSSDTELREGSYEYGEASAIETVERTAVDPDTGEECPIELPSTRVVKEALLDFDYPSSGIQVKDIAEVLADQFELSEEKRNARGEYGLVWRRHVNNTANILVKSEQLLRIKYGWIINLDQLEVETSDIDEDSLFSEEETSPPEAVIAQNYRDHLGRLKEELRQKIMDNPPEFFEELVLDLYFQNGILRFTRGRGNCGA